MTNLKPEEIINIEGKKGNSLFYRTIIHAVNQENFKNIQEKLDSYLKEYEKISDDRALAIIGALIIENELDNFLAEWIKIYSYLKNNKDLSFSFKVDLVISLKLIPRKILNAIEPIRKIRNVFAHNLDISTFEEAREFNSDSFSKLYGRIKTLIVWNKNDDKETFKMLVNMIILALNVYTKHITKVQDFIWNPKNLTRIIKE